MTLNEVTHFHSLRLWGAALFSYFNPSVTLAQVYSYAEVLRIYHNCFMIVMLRLIFVNY